jgi:hypothetical protein
VEESAIEKSDGKLKRESLREDAVKTNTTRRGENAT